MEPYRITAWANRLAEIPAQTYISIADFPIRQDIRHINASVKVFSYTKVNSPLQVRHQLAYSCHEFLTDSHLITHSFWVNKVQIMRSTELTNLYGPPGKGQPNALYAVEKHPAPWGTVAIVAVTVTTGATFYFLNHLNLFAGFSF